LKSRSEHLTMMIIAGEESGDARGAEVMAALLAENPDLKFFGIGGDRMSKLGLDLIFHQRETAFLGFLEVARHLPFIYKVFQTLKNELVTRKPDLVLLVDYPGFNLRFARQAKRSGYKTAYYVSPQVWAWGGGRVKKMASFIDRMHVIFPFEEEIYAKEGMDVRFVGHPLKGTCSPDSDKDTFFQREKMDPARPVLGLLPGSREQELSRLLPEMSEAGRLLQLAMPELQVITGAAPSLTLKDYQKYGNTAPLTRHTHDVMAFADVVLVASGTATLETAIFKTPMVICYKMAAISYAIGRFLVKVENIGLANIVAGKRVVPELIQGAATAENMADQVGDLLNNKSNFQAMQQDLGLVGQRLGPPEAAKQVAHSLIEMMAVEDD